jgi:hypothetical protein
MRRGSNHQPQQTLSYPPPRPTTRVHSVTAPSNSTSRRPQEERGGLGRIFDIVPEDRNYGFEDVFRGGYGDNAMLTPGNKAVRGGEDGHSPGPLFVKVDLLEQSKRKAANSFAQLCSAAGGHNHADEPALIATATRDQHDVLRDRIEVLNDLITQRPDPQICMRHKLLGKAPHTLVSVTYNRYVRESPQSEKEMGEIQSPMAWVVPGVQKWVAELLHTSEPSEKALKGLLWGLLKNMPFKYHSTKKLAKSLRAQYPTAMREEANHGIPSTHGQAHPQPSEITSHHLRVYSAESSVAAYKDKPSEHVKFILIVGALDLNVLEQWQNPSTNMLVRKSIVQTAVHHPPDGERLSNVHTLHLKILRGTESHVLSFRPFIGTEACTVSHLSYSEPASGGGGPKGMLHLGEDPISVQPLHGGQIHPIESYVCLGAHRESRYNEAQLNYIHSRAYARTKEEGGLAVDHARLPQARSIQWDSDMPAAKATRISGKDTDVMASSYHIGEQVHTVISVICYPPFGTQFKPNPKHKKTEGRDGEIRVYKPHKPKSASDIMADADGGAGTTITRPIVTRLPRRMLAQQETQHHKDISQMQARIQSLESKLEGTQQDGNTAHLMQEVLRKLQKRV